MIESFLRGEDMKDIPIFTTDYGVASIIMKEIPYRGIAYVRVQDVQPNAIRELMGECVEFCRAAGADAVFAAGHQDLECYPFHHSVLIMSGPADFEPEANLWPVTDKTVTRWREIYNQGMTGIDGAATMSVQDETRIFDSGGAYFVHRDGKLLGIGWVDDGELICVVGTQPGAGRCVLKTLLTAQSRDRVILEVASTNTRAIRLYESLGFIQTGVRSQWYQVL